MFRLTYLQTTHVLSNYLCMYYLPLIYIPICLPITNPNVPILPISNLLAYTFTLDTCI
jgi:hypothetical protein